MAKSKSKSKKSNKARKSSKAKKSVKQTKRIQQVPMAQANVAKASILSSAKISRTLVATVAIAVVIGAILIGGAEDKSIKSSAKPTINPNAQQTIEVKPPKSRTGAAEAAGYNLQGSSPDGQTARGGLQKPQTADQLQPNAKIDDFENAEIE